MNGTQRLGDAPLLRVLLAGRPGAASRALAIWVGDQSAATVTGPAPTMAEAPALVASFRPHVVLLDFHGVPVSTTVAVSLLKESSPSPMVIVLTHDASDAMRRRCQVAGVDAVFDKTRDLDAVATLLRATRARVT